MGDWIVEPVSLLGAFAVFLLSLLETVFPSIPAELIMPVPVYRAAPGEIDLPGAIVGVTFGLLLGAWIPYRPGHRLGQRRLLIVLKYLWRVIRPNGRNLPGA